MLSATVVFFFAEWPLLATAFSSNRIGRIILPHPVPILYNTKTDDVILSGADMNSTADANDFRKNSSKDKAAIIFLHGLGDSPDGWANLAEALPNLRPSLASLDITYVFPPAQMVGITVNGGEKMPGRFALSYVLNKHRPKS
jgi:hypothetical protein